MSSVARPSRRRRRRKSEEEQAGEQSDVHSGDDEEMEGAGALEAETECVGEAGAVAEEHGVEHSGVIGREAEERGGGGGWGWSECRRAGGRRPSFARRRCGSSALAERSASR